MLDVNWLNVDGFPIDTSVITRWLSFICVTESKVLDEVTIVFCSDDHLLKMNIEFLQHDYYTDIITFDYCEEDAIIGELYISVDRVSDNAKEVSVSFEDELHRVLVHGVLHLIGYGDKGDDEESAMRSKEDFYLNKLKGFT